MKRFTVLALLALSAASAWSEELSDFQRRFVEVAGAIPSPPEKSTPKHEVRESAKLPGYTRQLIEFEVEAGDRLTAYLCLPHKPLAEPAPAVLCLHPTSKFGKGQVVSLGDKANRKYGEELAQRGYVTLSPDYPGYGGYEPDVYAMGYASATAKGIYNHRRCVDLLTSLDEVDATRIGCIGHSLGGHNTLFAGLFEPRIRVMATSCGFNRFAKYYGGDLSGWSHRGYMPRIAEVYDKDPAKMPWDFPELLAELAPRPVFISAPLHDANFEVSGVRDCVAAARPAYAARGAADALEAVYPDCGHDFPPEVREQAYAFIDKALQD